jgi:hypothetical protein
MEEQLDLWSARLGALTSKIDPEVQAEHHKQLGEWRAAGQLAVASLADLKAATGDRWDELRLEMDRIWATLSTALEGAEAAMRAKEDVARAARGPEEERPNVVQQIVAGPAPARPMVTEALAEAETPASPAVQA